MRKYFRRKDFMGLRQRGNKWELRKQIKGHSLYYAFDHKPTKREIDDKLFELQENLPTFSQKGTFKDYAKDYVDIKKNVLSPSTIASYNSIIRNLSEGFLGSQFSSITNATIQRELNHYAIGRSPKTVKNACGFITAVCWEYNPNLQIKIKLPQPVKTDTYIPTDEEVKKVIEAIKGSKYEAVILLTIYGLRRSEAISVTSEDIEGNILTINKAIVQGEEGLKEKTTKTVSGTRKIYIPTYLADLIRKQGKAFEGYPSIIIKYLHSTQDKLGINRCKLHALRHYYVSLSHTLGVPDVYIANAVGHANISTTQNIYTHAQKEIELQYKELVSSHILG